MKSTLALVFLTLALTGFDGHPDPYPDDYFRAPLDLPLRLAGNFAEMRSNHFHAGLDLKTQNTEGHPVYAAASGYIARIVVSPVGYGNVLYIAHPNGYTTVYAHLQRFEGAVADYIDQVQYQREQFRVDVSPKPGRFQVGKGERIGLSGNSGSSGGPHLHFEVRDAAQRPINPLLFGFDIPDTTPPRIFAVKLYAQPGGFAVIERAGAAPTYVTPGHPAIVEATGTNSGRYWLPDGTTLRAHGEVGFAVRAHDYHEGSSSRLGAYRITLTADEQPLYQSEMETFSFDETRYLNAHVDYAEHRHSRLWFQRSHLLPGNRLPFYRTTNQGFLRAQPGTTHGLAYLVEDAMGNAATLRFEVNGAPADAAPPAPESLPHDRWVVHTRSATFAPDGLKLTLSARTFYEDLPLRHEVGPAPEGAFSAAHTLSPTDAPLHRSATLALRADALPAALRSKARLARLSPDGEATSAGGTYENGYVRTRTRALGTFFVTADTTPPTITPLGFSDGQDLRRLASLRLRIKDDFSGIDDYRGTIDGRWVRFAYDAKRDLLTYTFDERVGPGAHTLRMVVTDGVGHETTYTARFTR